VEQYYQDVLASQESEEAFVQDLTNTFGWTVEEFKSRVVESIVLALQMSEAILADESLQQSRRDTIDTAYTRVAGGEDFASVAKEVNARFDAGLEADLGYIKLSIIPESWAAAVEILETGTTTDVLDLPEGYAIFKAEDRIVAAEDTQIHLLSITVPKVTLEEVVKEYLETAKVKRYVGEI
jgi:parvulin-like peptidyl-prolyl isomerase